MKEKCTQEIKDLYKCTNLLFTGRACSAFALVLKTEQLGTVIFPATICHSIVFTAQSMGWKIAFADVKLSDGTIDPDSLERLLLKVRGVKVVLAANMFGNRCDMRALKEKCNQSDAILIEDGAQSFGMEGMGEFSDYLLLSFGYSKIIDVGGGGAVLTSNSKKYQQLKDSLELLKSINLKAHQARAKLFKVSYHFFQEHQEVRTLFSKFYPLMEDQFLLNDAAVDYKSLLLKLKKTNEAISRRRQNYQVYLDMLQERKDIKILKPEDIILDSVPWRFTFLTKNQERNSVLQYLWSKNIDASPYYRSVANDFGGAPQPNASLIEKNVINLWVNYQEKSQVIEAAETLLQALK